MKYRIITLVGLLALSAGSILQAQDYDDIYYDGSKSTTTKTKKTTVVTPAKTVAVYGEVPDNYKVAAKGNYRVERDEDEYNRRGAYDPSNLNYEVDINGDTIYIVDNDTIYEEAFANTRLIERFYNPDIVILSDDDDLVELYYDESPTINLVVGSDWGYGSYWSSYYPWYTGWHYPWYSGWYDHWYTPWYSYSYYHWGWGWPYSNWYYSRWYGPRLWGWDYWGPRPWSNTYHGNWYGWNGVRPHHSNGGVVRPGVSSGGHRVGLASNRNGRGRVDATTSSRNGIGARGADGNRPGVGTSSNRGSGRGGYATGRGGNMGSRGTSGVTTRSGGVSRTPASTGSRSYNGGSRSYSGGSRSYSGGSSSSGRSYSGGSSHSSGGSYSGGSHSSGGGYSGGGSHGGGSHGGSSGGGGHRR